MYCLTFFSGQRKFWILNHLRKDSMKLYDVRHQWRGRRIKQRFARAWIHGFDITGSQQDWVPSPAVTGEDVDVHAYSVQTAQINPPETGCLLEERA
jgi:ribosomal protein S12 methylthiotransferase accessory factor YcaO